MSGSKIGFVSLGCPKNLVDGEVMLGLARDAGHEITADARDAEVIVVNTCAFIDNAKEESIDAILEMAQLKRDGACKRLVVTGCLAERYRDQLRTEIPEIDAVLGTGEVPEIVNAVTGAPIAPAPITLHGPLARGLSRSRGLSRLAKAGAGPLDTDHGASPGLRQTGQTGACQGASPGLRQAGQADACQGVSPGLRQTGQTPYLYDHSTPRLRTTPPHLAYLKVAEGCDYTCAFCIIPSLRGNYRSRDEDSIVREAERLAGEGVRELLLISQDTSFFGVDRGERGALGRLLCRLNEIDGLAWIRMLYLYPTTITDDVLEAMAACDKVCKYIDLPLQHASADVLRRMRRPGNREAYDKLLARIRARVPHVTLRTTFIVGFPGETEQDFAALCDFVRDTGFDHVGVFTYSHEEGTRAFALEDDVPARVKRQRRDALMTLQKQVVARRNRARVGEPVRVIVDGPSPESPLVLQGRLEGQAPDIDSIVFLSDCDPSTIAAGELVTARVTGMKGYDFVASVV